MTKTLGEGFTDQAGAIGAARAQMRRNVRSFTVITPPDVEIFIRYDWSK
jgi:hypothetical protein